MATSREGGPVTCQVCGYHSGPLTVRQQACPRVHLTRPIEPVTIETLRARLAVWERSVSPNAAEMIERCRADIAAFEQEQDDAGAHHYEMESQ